MSYTHAMTHAKLKLIERWFPNASEALCETLEVLMDVDQLGLLLKGMDETRQRKVVSMDTAFGDL